MRRRCILRRLGLIQGEEKGKDRPPKGRGPRYIYRGHLAGRDVKEREKEKKSAGEPVRRDTKSGEQERLTNRRRDLLGAVFQASEVGESIGGDVDERLDGDSLLGNRRLN